jgi:hypothetical protein
VLERSTVCYFQAGFKVGIATFVGEVNNHVIGDRCSQCYLSFYVLGCIKCHDASLKVDYAGSMMKFSTKGSLSYNDKEVSTDITFDATKDIEGKITLRTPISDDMIASLIQHNQL